MTTTTRAAKGTRVECQVCGGFYAADRHGNPGHHGFKRPGWGYTVGRCRGAGRAPYPATDALVEAEAEVADMHAAHTDRLAALNAGTVRYLLAEKRGYGGAVDRIVEMAVGVTDLRCLWPAYDTAIVDAKNGIYHAGVALTFLRERIAAAATKA